MPDETPESEVVGRFIQEMDDTDTHLQQKLGGPYPALAPPWAREAAVRTRHARNLATRSKTFLSEYIKDLDQRVKALRDREAILDAALQAGTRAPPPPPDLGRGRDWRSVLIEIARVDTEARLYADAKPRQVEAFLEMAGRKPPVN